MRRYLTVAFVLVALLATAVPALAADDVGVVDGNTGIWYLRDADNGATTSFYYGNPGDAPFTGDWDCDGVATPGLYRVSDGYAYLRNSNSEGVADVRFFFGNPGDIPLAGDFDGDGCDTLSLYRPSEARFYIINELGSNDAGLGAAEYSFPYGNFGDQPFVGDFDGDGVDAVAVYRPGSGSVYLADDFGGSDAIAEQSASAGGTVFAGDWGGTGDDVAWYSDGGTFQLPGESFAYGYDVHVPVAGDFGTLPGGDEPPPAAPPYPNVGSGKRIIYSNTEQRVWLIDEHESLVSTYPVSGRKGIPLPGDYQVYSMSLKAYAPYGGITMSHMVRFVRPGTFGNQWAYGFHSIPRYPDGRPMQTVDELGYYRSGGCVRQEDWRAEFLFNWVDIGTPVHALP